MTPGTAPAFFIPAVLTVNQCFPILIKNYIAYYMVGEAASLIVVLRIVYSKSRTNKDN